MDLKKIHPRNQKCALPLCKECRGGYIILLLVALFIVFYFFLLRGMFGSGVVGHDLMNRKVFDFPVLENCCSLWPLSHFVLFFFLGLLFPECTIPFLAIGVGWELFEVGVAKFEGGKRQQVRSGKNVEYSKNWWAGSFKDILMNFVGFLLGRILAKSGVKFCSFLNSETRACSGKFKSQES